LPDALPSPVLWRSALIALALIAAGLASSTLHLANPKNAWRSLARIRTSWLSREAAGALALFPVASLYIVLVARGNAVPARALLALASVLLAWAVLFCTAMIYASLKPIRQWHTGWTPVNYVLLGHWSGVLLLATVASADAAAPAGLLLVASAVGFAALAAKLAYWIAVGGLGSTTLSHALGVDAGVRAPGAPATVRARLFDAGHSRATFLTHEFGFVVARRYATVLRGIALALGFGFPLGYLIRGIGQWHLTLGVALCCIVGLLVERWLFFAEAKHTVRLYHGDAHT
jgi:DMSO reductase anchor subunit